MKLLYPLKINIITQKFGLNPQVYKPMGLNGHNGIDFRTINQNDAGGVGLTYVYASADGTVEQVRNDTAGYGKHVRLRHTDGSLTLYAHFSEHLVKVGDKVRAGDKIGVTGNTGFSSGPHLHFEFRPAGESANNGYAGAVDPLPYLTMPNNEAAIEKEKAIQFVKDEGIMSVTTGDIDRESLAVILYRFAKKFTK